MQEDIILYNLIAPSIVNFIIAMLTVGFGYYYVMRQIKAMRKIEEEKRVIAIYSLILELEYNKQIIEDYIQHSEVGDNLGKSEDRFSWEWNSPNFENYKHVILACYTNIKLAYAITNIYSKLQACKVIVEHIHQLLASNLQIREQVINGEKLLRNEIVKLNTQLLNISKGMESSFNQPIEELTNIKNSLR